MAGFKVLSLVSRLWKKFRTEANTSPCDFQLWVESVLGYPVRRPELYFQAFTLCHGTHSQYERLEFLGDAILGSIISAHLFSLHPQADEGKLTQLKSKIVSRKSLNVIGEELGVCDWIKSDSPQHSFSANICGNLLEAFIGAIYLDQGYARCEEIVLGRILSAQRIGWLQNRILSYKGVLLEWSQKQKDRLPVIYKTQEEKLPGESSGFRTEVFLGEKRIATARESSKKKSEEKAAQRAFYALNPKEGTV